MKYWLPLTYPPKIQGVIDGTILQTIWPGTKYRVGDEVAFHGWQGKPYHSPWSFRTPFRPLTQVINCLIKPEGIKVTHLFEWEFWETDYLAKLDGIVPPTGIALRDVLTAMHRIPAEGIPAQVLRWKP